MATHGNLWSDEVAVEDGFPPGAVGERGRKNSASRVSFSPGAGSRGRPYSASGSTSAVKPYRRRTSLSASQLPGPSVPTLVPSGAQTSPFSTILPDNSQTGLEKVIKSRLVETCLSIFIPPSTSADPPNPGLVSQPSSSSTTGPRDRSSASQRMKSADNNLPRKVTKILPFSPSEKIVTHIREAVFPRYPSSKTTNYHVQSASTSTLRPNGKISRNLHSFPPPQKPSLHGPQVPNYLSPVCRPSTNPSFPIDARSIYSLSEGCDLGGSKMKIEVLGRVGDWWKRDVSFQRKGKEKELEDADDEWKILDEWHVDLSDLVPLSDDVRSCLLLGNKIMKILL